MSRQNVGVIRFPGTNCDRDVFAALERETSYGKGRVHWLWHADRFEHREFAALVLPGGFSYGDYLRSGALAARSPAMKSVREAADAGVPVLGICNGFQVLCEAGLLPGALVRNRGLRFVDDWVALQLQNPVSAFAGRLAVGHRARLPVAHADGRFFAEEDEIKSLEDNGQIWWRYLENPNGSWADIAGVMNKKKNVAGLMPHPERAVENWMGTADGEAFFSV
jgi:phosphoribosylformylglycinamidine synthase I